MHGRFYVCLPKAAARTKSGVVKKVTKFLNDEGLVGGDRLWGGPADYFSIGGRWGGTLELLRLRAQDSQTFGVWWEAHKKPGINTRAKAVRLFKKHFRGYKSDPPVFREADRFGDAEGEIAVMDAALFDQLQAGFGEFTIGDWELHEPNVIFTDGTPEAVAEEVVGRYWVAVIDYHW